MYLFSLHIYWVMLEYNMFNITKKFIIFVKISAILLNYKSEYAKIKLQQDVIKIWLIETEAEYLDSRLYIYISIKQKIKSYSIIYGYTYLPLVAHQFKASKPLISTNNYVINFLIKAKLYYLYKYLALMIV